MAEKSIPYEAGSTLVHDGISFPVPFIFGTKLKIKIRPLLPGTIVRESMEVMKLKKAPSETIDGLLDAGTNYKIFARMIAIAHINNRKPGTMLTRLLTWILLWKIKSPADMLAYVAIVYRQMDANRFFFIMVLTKGMNYLETKAENTGEEKPFGEQ